MLTGGQIECTRVNRNLSVVSGGDPKTAAAQEGNYDAFIFHSFSFSFFFFIPFIHFFAHIYQPFGGTQPGHILSSGYYRREEGGCRWWGVVQDKMQRRHSETRRLKIRFISNEMIFADDKSYLFTDERELLPGGL